MRRGGIATVKPFVRISHFVFGIVHEDNGGQEAERANSIGTGAAARMATTRCEDEGEAGMRWRGGVKVDERCETSRGGGIFDGGKRRWRYEYEGWGGR